MMMMMMMIIIIITAVATLAGHAVNPRGLECTKEGNM